MCIDVGTRDVRLKKGWRERERESFTCLARLTGDEWFREFSDCGACSGFVETIRYLFFRCVNRKRFRFHSLFCDNDNGDNYNGYFYLMICIVSVNSHSNGTCNYIRTIFNKIYSRRKISIHFARD